MHTGGYQYRYALLSTPRDTPPTHAITSHPRPPRGATRPRRASTALRALLQEARHRRGAQLALRPKSARREHQPAFRTRGAGRRLWLRLQSAAFGAARSTRTCGVGGGNGGCDDAPGVAQAWLVPCFGCARHAGVRAAWLAVRLWSAQSQKRAHLCADGLARCRHDSDVDAVARTG